MDKNIIHLFLYSVRLPGQPSAKVTSVAATSISLSWSVPSGSVVTSYEVVWGESKAETGMSSGSLNTTSYTIHNLDSSTLYKTIVRATNIAGTTDSTPIIISTSKIFVGVSIYIQMFSGFLSLSILAVADSDNVAIIVEVVCSITLVLAIAVTVIVIAALVFKYRRAVSSPAMIQYRYIATHTQTPFY